MKIERNRNRNRNRIEIEIEIEISNSRKKWQRYSNTKVYSRVEKVASLGERNEEPNRESHWHVV